MFTYLDAFDPDRNTVHELKAHYRRGDLGDTAVKRQLKAVLLDLLAPIRERRAAWTDRPDDVLWDGTCRARIVTQATLEAVKEALSLFRLGPDKPSLHDTAHGTTAGTTGETLLSTPRSFVPSAG